MKQNIQSYWCDTPWFALITSVLQLGENTNNSEILMGWTETTAVMKGWLHEVTQLRAVYKWAFTGTGMSHPTSGAFLDC